MKKLILLGLLSIVVAGCQTASEPKAQPNPAGSENAPAAKDDLQTVSSHSQEKGPNVESPASGAPEMGSPRVKPLDVTKMTADIDKAKAAYEKNTKDENAKKALAKAYFDRAHALTAVAQYRSAIGDFRKGLKLDPNDGPAKAMHDEIIRIFESVGREAPKEGEEPAPLPVNN